MSGEEVKVLGNATRIGFIVILFGISYLNIRLSLGIEFFDQIFRDMLGSRPLPAMTGFIVSARTSLIVLSCLLPIAGLITAASMKCSSAIFSLSAFMAVAVLQTITTGHALMAPLLTIVHQMQQM